MLSSWASLSKPRILNELAMEFLYIFVRIYLLYIVPQITCSSYFCVFLPSRVNEVINDFKHEHCTSSVMTTKTETVYGLTCSMNRVIEATLTTKISSVNVVICIAAWLTVQAHSALDQYAACISACLGCDMPARWLQLAWTGCVTCLLDGFN